jgi:hypothetical protein
VVHDVTVLAQALGDETGGMDVVFDQEDALGGFRGP